MRDSQKLGVSVDGDTPKSQQSICTIDYNAHWCFSPLPNVADEQHWRQITNSIATDVVIASENARRYYEVNRSTIDRMVIMLPDSFNPALFSWPVFGLPVSLVEVGVYERTLFNLCVEYGATSITLLEHRLNDRTIVLPEMLGVAA